MIYSLPLLKKVLILIYKLMFKYILKIFKFVSTDLLYIEVIYFFVVHALRTSSARFAKTQLLELYIKNMPIKLWYNLNLDYTKGGLRQMQFFAKCIRACRGYGSRCCRHTSLGGLRLCQYHRHSLRSQKNWGVTLRVRFAGSKSQDIKNKI